MVPDRRQALVQPAVLGLRPGVDGPLPHDGIAAYLVSRKGLEAPGVKEALWLFLIQLGLNGIWSFLFFGMRAPGIAFAEIVILWCVIVATCVAFFQQSKTAGALLVPYWVRVSFAAVLNYWLWRLNA
jgi:tryptophan-rich sensory protein